MAASAYSHLVSVITPAYNAGQVIERAIRSVSNQTVPVLEHIIIDDGSTDGTVGIIRKLQEEFPWVRYLAQPRQGAGAARNLGIKEARGRYIAFLDGDDIWLEGKAEHQIGFMEGTGALFSYGAYLIRDAVTGRLIREIHPPDRLDHGDLLRACPIGCLTVAYNQERYGKVYMPLVERGQDWGLWLALTRDGTPALKYPGTDAIYYCAPGSLSSNKLRKSLDIYRIYREEEGMTPLQATRYLALHVLSKF